MNENEEKDDLLLDIEGLRYKHILLRNLHKKAMISIDELEAKNLKLNDDNIELRESVQRLSQANTTANMLMVSALTNNNAMKEDYRKRINELEEQLKNK